MLWKRYLKTFVRVLSSILAKQWKLTRGFELVTYDSSQPANIGPQELLGTSPGRPLNILFDRPGDVPIWRRWDVDSGRPQDVLRTSPRGPWEYSNLDV